MITIIPVEGIGVITKGMDFPGQIWSAAGKDGKGLLDGDVLVVSSKAVSKWEGNVRNAADIKVSPQAAELSGILGKTAAYCQVVLDETVKTVRLVRGLMISRNKQGFVLANAGVDASNTQKEGDLIPLPADSDASARRIRDDVRLRHGIGIAVIVSDTFGRTWRKGQTDMAVGVAGIAPLLDYSGRLDSRGRKMKTTCIAVADELAGAANLAAEKTAMIPAVIIRGYGYQRKESSIGEVLMEEERDLFQ